MRAANYVFGRGADAWFRSYFLLVIADRGLFVQPLAE
jgi:hypothetical protein